MARRKQAAIPGQLNLFDVLTELKGPAPVGTRIIDMAYQTLHHSMYAPESKIVRWLVFGKDKTTSPSERTITIGSTLNKSVLIRQLRACLEGYLFKVKKDIAFGKSTIYYISDIEKRRVKSTDGHVVTRLPVYGENAVPKLLRERTERYLNEPYNMSQLDAFKRAVSEYKHPSKRLRMAIEKDDYRDYLPDEYEGVKQRKGALRTMEYAA